VRETAQSQTGGPAESVRRGEFSRPLLESLLAADLPFVDGPPGRDLGSHCMAGALSPRRVPRPVPAQSQRQTAERQGGYPPSAASAAFRTGSVTGLFSDPGRCIRGPRKQPCRAVSCGGLSADDRLRLALSLSRETVMSRQRSVEGLACLPVARKVSGDSVGPPPDPS